MLSSKPLIFKHHNLIYTSFIRLKEVLYSEKSLYLVFEYLEYDLKKFLKAKGSALPYA